MQPRGASIVEITSMTIAGSVAERWRKEEWDKDITFHFDLSLYLSIKLHDTFHFTSHVASRFSPLI